MLKRIYIHNFRTFVNFEWTPPPACVLVGANGSGKSALLEVLWILQDVVVEGRLVDETPLASAATAWLAEAEQVIEVELARAGETFTYRLTCRREQGRSEVKEELRAGGALLYASEGGRASLYGNNPLPEPRTVIPFDRRRSFLAALEPRPDNSRLIAFREAINSIWAMKPNPARLGGAATNESPYLERDLSNFAAWYRSRVQEDPDGAEQLRSDLKGALPGFVLLRLEPIATDVKDLRVRFGFGGRTHELTWAKLSDGQRQLVALYGMLHFGLPQAGLIALDEIENYVAPAEIQPWLQKVADLANEGGRQLLVISHHPEAIDYLAADAIWRMWRDPDTGNARIAPLEPDRSAGETAYDLVKRGELDG